ncbi:Outer membrane lipoprotein-sorting protein [Halovenus aranensis]|jgi:outer membrane lipoprotein-sorting protein|uniref:Outer membrane lipoprotein-sorting protein n=1 Tax=Halovenus aranensis TaxID=890420 RepID=A0A1G8WRN7_9EURY|nr:hypothetical protein [Halovenus aranensis]SDJ81062.1 Outer membrane lipoprotein-sorting protein [Halovenus aranensis]
MARIHALVVLCLLLTVGAGCLTFGDDNPTTETLLADLNETDPPETVAATFEANWTYEGATLSLSYDAWYRSDGASRVENDVGGRTTVTVDDGDRRWRYDPGQNTVRVRPGGSGDDPVTQMRRGLARILQTAPVTDIRETQYQGRTVYHLTLDPAGDRDQLVPPLLPGGITSRDEQLDETETPFNTTRMELWVDAEYMFLVKQRIEGEETGVFRYRNITFEGVDDDRFEFEVPENATVQTPTDSENATDARAPITP